MRSVGRHGPKISEGGSRVQGFPLTGPRPFLSCRATRRDAVKSVQLKSDRTIPTIGMGTWPLKGAACVRAIREALDIGYRHLDTAWMYQNQGDVGQALIESDVSRDDVFITSKVWRTHLHYDGVLQQHAETLRDLDVSSVDLFLVHWPNRTTPMAETFRAMSRLYDEGSARSIGVSNFGVAQLEEAIATSSAPICVNQIRYHPKHQQRDILVWCHAHDVAVTAYSPLAKGQLVPALSEIGSKIGRSPAQVTLRWLIEEGLVVIPKASSRAHLEENFDLFGWALPDGARDEIRSIGDP